MMTDVLWDTGVMLEQEQFDFWCEAVSEAFVPVAVARQESGAFLSRVAARRVSEIGVSRLASQAQSVIRGPELVRRDPGDVFFLNLPLTEGTVAIQDGRSAHLGRHDFAIVDSSRPFELAFSEPFTQISVTLPHELLVDKLGGLGDITAVRVRGDHGVGAVASGAIRGLAFGEGVLDRQAARALTGWVAGLIALALNPAPAVARSSPRRLLLAAALEELDRSLSDPELTPARLAERLGISTRYLHRLFAELGEPFGRRLLSRRLQRCRADLVDPDRRHWTIAQIAFEHGFVDPSYMARAFKQHYGISPRQQRPAAQAPSTPTA